MKSLRLFAVALVLLLAGSCSSENPPERADYMLQWYPKPGTDYGDLVPGFRSLSMCRRAGAGKTLAVLYGREEIAIAPGGPVAATENQPWFECLSKCRPYRKGSYLLVCKHVASFQGFEALRPY